MGESGSEIFVKSIYENTKRINKSKVVSSIYVFRNGNLIVFDEDGEQIPKLQYNIISDIRKKGYKVDNDIVVKGLVGLFCGDVGVK
jgi:hypothetical protein